MSHKRPQLLIIVLFENLDDQPPYYMKMWTPPATGLLVAALTPPVIDVEVLHEMVRPIDWSTEADYVALSFWDFQSRHAFRVARRFRDMGKVVIAGGRYPTSHPDECQPHFDAVVVGCAHTVWPGVVEDLVAGRLKQRYTEAPDASMAGIPPPRYDRAERGFFFPAATEASRGCRYACSFCQLTVDEERFRRLRLRPVGDVVADLAAAERLSFFARRVVNIVDNNLASVPQYGAELLDRIAERKFWGVLAQFSVDSLRDDQFVDRLEKARCAMVFIGLESMVPESLASVNKHQNKVEEYTALLRKLKRKGIVSFCGVVLGFDGDTAEYYDQLVAKLDEVGIDVLMLSIVAPIPGSDWERELKEQGRLLDTDIAKYDGCHVIVRPRLVAPEKVLETYGRVLASFYSWPSILKRYLRYLRGRPWLGLLPGSLRATVIGSAVFWHLSLLYRRHTRVRIVPLLRQQMQPVGGASGGRA